MTRPINTVQSVAVAGKQKRNAGTKYPTNVDPLFFAKEQLRLFAFNGSSPHPTDIPPSLLQKLSKRERLAVLLEGELNFHGENSSYASHDLHAFAAKFPPQLPRAFIRGLTETMISS